METNVSGIEQEGLFMPEEIENFNNTLYQLFITNEIAQGNTTLDLKADLEFHQKKEQGNNISSGFIHQLGGLLLNNKETNKKLHEYLEELFLQLNPQYSDYFLIFAFDLPLVLERVKNGQIIYNQTTMGNINKIGDQLAVLYRSIIRTSAEPRDHTTLNHETLHGFGLMHTHKEKYTNGNFVPITEPEKKYTYPNANDLSSSDKAQATDNVMSYNPEAKTLWQWQRQFIKTKKT